MPVKDAINAFLTRTTGYRLERATPRLPTAGTTGNPTQDALAQLTEANRGLKDDVRKYKREANRAKAELRKERGDDGAFPSDFDEEAREIIRAVRPFTMTGNDKLHALIQATRYVATHKIPGDVVECGVWRGGSMHAVARTLTACGDQTRDLYLFDTFEGMPPPSEHDVRHDGKPAERLLAAGAKDSKVWAVAGLDDVQAGFEGVPYPADKVHFVKGMVEQTVPAEVPDTISILRLDTDWYESTAHELLHMWDRLVSGGVLMIDDYGHWKGSRRATDEFLERTGAQLLLVRMNTGRVAVKP
jgi:hypothetical protein